MKILFIIRKSRVNAKGKCPVNCRVTINGVQGVPFSTGLFVDPKRWDAGKQKAKDSVIDTELTRIRARLTDLFFEERASGKILFPQAIINLYRFGKPEPISWESSLSDYIAVLFSKKRAKSTLGIYRRHVGNFSKWVQIAPNQVQREHIVKYYNHLLSRGYAIDYANKCLQGLYGYFKYLLNSVQINHNPVMGVEVEWENKEDTTHLTSDELLKILNTDWSPRIQKAVDAFLFMSYSGMHVGDYLRMDESWIKSEGESSYIEYRRQKTSKEAQIPLNAMLSSLILKYNGVEKLPKLPAQHINNFLKIVAERCEIDKLLTCKVGRKTFTDMCLNERKLPQEIVSLMLGHSSVNYVKKYGRVRVQRILSEWKDSDDPVVEAMRAT